MATVSLEDVRKVYRGGVVAVKGVTLRVADGEFVSLVGPSGCGKSTTLNLIAGLEDLSGGTLRIDGAVVNDLSPKERDIAMVFQSYALYPHMDVARNLAFPLEVLGMSRADIDARVREVATTLGLESLLSRRPKELSGGQRQRVALGRALVRRPKVFLFDEPLSNLDAALRTQMRGEIKKLHERLAATFIYVTHDQAEAMTLSDRVVVMSQGEVQQVAPPRELYDAPANLFVAGFFGSPRINLVKPRTLGLPEGDDVVLGLRPEQLDITSSDVAGALSGRVYLVEPMGPESWVTVDVAGEHLVARAPGDFRAATGSPVCLRYDPAKLRRFDAQSGRAR
ncbi:ABC transporter ATP-binding protein [Myxococcus sp. K15C18031901]|uniref:ABC transporter ATP-binding protein n=1 Tax=Myxococcus dinghuensis TaxID=2906761 RepID=UPI0020A7A74B|nr:ATP-binding cassette domain-containing protein [Myxococcus dinghuensis]MCP3102638.1 ABC transporter ATP-binding protein [Myxococcus dinghuensis]